MIDTKWYLPAFAGLLLAASAFGADPFDRLMSDVRSTEKWKGAKTVSEKMWAIRSVAGSYKVVSKPVSDRYLITRCAGPIDFVHFLGLAAMVCQGREVEEVLLDQWTREGGPDFEAKRTSTYWTEAHPDDLPSNALGALFGAEVRARNQDESFPLVEELRSFFDRLSPYPDSLITRYAHAQVVMGLDGSETAVGRRKRSEWFTAVPLFLIPLLEPGLLESIPNARAGLKKAGLEVYDIDGKPIGIRRVHQDAHD